MPSGSGFVKLWCSNYSSQSSIYLWTACLFCFICSRYSWRHTVYLCLCS